MAVKIGKEHSIIMEENIASHRMKTRCDMEWIKTVIEWITEIRTKYGCVIKGEYTTIIQKTNWEGSCTVKKRISSVVYRINR